MRKSHGIALTVLLVVGLLVCGCGAEEAPVAGPEPTATPVWPDGAEDWPDDRLELLAWAVPKGSCPYTFTANCVPTMKDLTRPTVQHYKCSGSAPAGGAVIVYVWTFDSKGSPVCIGVTKPKQVGSSGTYAIDFSIDRKKYSGRIDVDVVAQDASGVACLSACDKLEN